ncbi:hypothetical protein ABL78_4651 [Leptomonas seymouri]|uniref:Uncharacterized protein n=1 Tax=Leptomonas seymouri TaxID=5684 RepID=A0A0N1PCZ4_LEPSE|nr:hypothetical protein ABL78_4651 [Leptomonas seymouri]|eukprot:KPI86304.1 hypothetical protein ABL78_4651 [Leptomonas seymouri]
MSESHTAATEASSSSPAATLPYPNVLQARHITEAHRRTAAAATLGYQENLVDEQARLENEDLVLSEEETVWLQQRLEWQRAANAAAAQFRQCACDVVKSIKDSDDAQRHSGNNASSVESNGSSATEKGVDVYHAACDGDVGLLAQWAKEVSPSSLSSRVNALGQPDPATYNGVQFKQRWLFRAPPLTFAAAFGREEAVSFLLAHGADPRVKSSTGLRAVDYAERRGYTNIVVMLRGEQ